MNYLKNHLYAFLSNMVKLILYLDILTEKII